MSGRIDRPEIVTFVPTPFSNDQIDTKAIRQQMSTYAELEISVGLLGGIGEFFALSLEESTEIMQAAVEGAEGHSSVYAGIGFATREAVALAKAASQAGCAGVVLNPHYYVRPSPQGYADHVRAVTEASGLSAVVYSSSTLKVDDEYLEKLVKIEGFRGVKDEVSTADGVAKFVDRWGERVEFWAVGELGARDFVRAGAKTVTSALANICPRASVEYLVASEVDDGLEALFKRSEGFFTRERGTYASVAKEMIAAVKPTWPTEVRLPSSTVSPTLRNEIRELMGQVMERYSSIQAI